jgi:hypothetical protein
MVANQEIELSATEQRLERACAEGSLLDLRAGGDDGPQNVSSWGPKRHVRADAIARLLTGAPPGRAEGPPRLRLAGARVTGELRLAHATIGVPAEFVHCAFDEGVDLAEASAVTFRLEGCYLDHLEADRLRLRGVLTAHGCRMSWVSLYAARITEVDLSGTTLSRPGDLALNGDLLIVEAAIYLHDLRIEGQVRLPGARIAGYLRLNGTSLSHAGGPALLAQGLRVETGLYAVRGYKETHDPFSVTGQILLDGAQIGGGLHLNDARLNNPGGVALSADHAVIDGGLSLSGALTRGGVRLSSARITGRLDFAGTLADGGRCGDPARLDGTLDLSMARVGALHDEPRAWPPELLVDGLVYEDLDDPLTARQRLDWLARSPKFRPQPFRQLAAFYRASGRDDDARLVLLIAQRMRRRTLGRGGRAWGVLLDMTVGYGYRPWLAGAWLFGLLAAGSAYFAGHRPTPLPAYAGLHFNPVVYTLDLLVPLVSLGQANDWNPTGGSLAVAYALIISGWILVAALVAGVTRVLNRT